MRTIKTHFLFLTLASLGLATVAFGDDRPGSGSTSKVAPSRQPSVSKTTKLDTPAKIDPSKTSKVLDSSKITKVDTKPNTKGLGSKVLDTGNVTKLDTKTKTDLLGSKVLETAKKPMNDKRVVQVTDLGKSKLDAKAPGIKLGGAKFDHAEFSKLKPKIDLTKVKPEKVLAGKPPVDFKVKPIGLDKLHLPNDALKLNSVHAGLKFSGQKFIMNKNFCTTSNYHLHHGVKCGYGYCYHGKHHCHWHHCMWDPCYGCYYYYDPCVCSYYYWSEVNCCYYPCHWFVEYQSCSYPWWLCGGFESFGYCGSAGINIHVGINIK